MTKTKMRNLLSLILAVLLSAATSVVSAAPISGNFTGLPGGDGTNGAAGADGVSCVGVVFLPGVPCSEFVFSPSFTSASGGAGSPGFIGGDGGLGFPSYFLGAGVTATITGGTFLGGLGGNGGAGGQGGTGGTGNDAIMGNSPCIATLDFGPGCPDAIGGAGGQAGAGAPGGAGMFGGSGLLVLGTNTQVSILGGDFTGGLGGTGGNGGHGGRGGIGGSGEQLSHLAGEPAQPTPIVGGVGGDGGLGGTGGAGGSGGIGLTASGAGVNVDIFGGTFFGGGGGAGGFGGHGGEGFLGGWNALSFVNHESASGGQGGAGGLGFGSLGALGHAGEAAIAPDGAGGAGSGAGGSGGRGGQAGFFNFGLWADDNAIIEIHASAFSFDETTGELDATFFDGTTLHTDGVETRGGQIVWSQEPLEAPCTTCTPGTAPEPATLALLALGLAGLGFSRRRNRANSSC